jgi:hypothetical protein
MNPQGYALKIVVNLTQTTLLINSSSPSSLLSEQKSLLGHAQQKQQR